jgi:uncharacterized protein (TIGR03032 family)
VFTSATGRTLDDLRLNCCKLNLLSEGGFPRAAACAAVVLPAIYLTSYHAGMSDSANDTPVNPDSPPLRSVHTNSFPNVLAELGSSVMVTTYQAGKLILLRNRDGLLNTHFRSFVKPMGLAAAAGRLAVGEYSDIWEFHNVPAVCSKLDAQSEKPPSANDAAAEAAPAAADAAPTLVRPKHDACFLPRRSHITGDVQIHEMAWIGDELWFVNTAFSCLSTRSETHSFEPRWQPSFIHRLMPGDCCHLNGLAVRDGRPAYVTALGETNNPGGWRQNKRNGGVLIDVDSGEIITRGLSMPHSPRWHHNRLWLLESGDGSIGTIDLNTGTYEVVARLPGFTRGLSFIGPFAFIGLSQVRESAIFSGIPVVERLDERVCGVWIVNVETGEAIAFVRFEDAVQEIFAVEALPGMRFPDLINHDLELIARAYILSNDALELVPQEMRVRGL